MADFMQRLLTEIRDEIRGLRSTTNERFVEVRDELRELKATVGGLEGESQSTNARLAVLVQITRGIDTRLQKIEGREPDRAFLPQRVTALEERMDRLEAASEE